MDCFAYLSRVGTKPVHCINNCGAILMICFGKKGEDEDGASADTRHDEKGELSREVEEVKSVYDVRPFKHIKGLFQI
ncbi:hypothetical protein KY284_026212 [Solanum tuberosum]|nr:hypothetical protein KY284_026212 [Solanum tuberosum]